MSKKKANPDPKQDKKLIGLVGITAAIIVALFILSEVAA